jgi:polyphosphate kinase 2 (PPK2 family)
MQHFPAAGGIVIFNRSWYNRAGVEHVMGLCIKEQYWVFLDICPDVEKYIVEGGIILLTYWFEVSCEEQERRFHARLDDPIRPGTLSPMDLPSLSRWFDYSRVRDAMPRATHTTHAPWHILRSDDKKRTRLNCISHLLSQTPYKKLSQQGIRPPQLSHKGGCDDQAALKGRNFVPDKY